MNRGRKVYCVCVLPYSDSICPCCFSNRPGIPKEKNREVKGRVDSFRVAQAINNAVDCSSGWGKVLRIRVGERAKRVGQGKRQITGNHMDAKTSGLEKARCTKRCLC